MINPILASQAIKELAPNAEFAYRNDDLDTMEWHTPDIAQPSKKNIEAKIKELEMRVENEKAAKIAARQSAVSKLIDLGLTEDEAKAFLG